MTISGHLDRFAGLKVVDYDPTAGFRRGRPGAVAYRLRLEYEDTRTFPELFGDYLGRKGAAETTALIIGAWDGEMDEDDEGNSAVVAALVAAREQLPKLQALFLGDITADECEISWLRQSDVAPLLSAYPQLDEFRVRGAEQLTFGKLRHDNLRTLAVESCGLPAEIIKEISTARLPKLEHLELWLGTATYDGIETVAPLKSLLSGRRFPKLRYLGLRNSDIADEVARAVATAPVLKSVRVLDLSMGNLGDEGARALIASAAVRGLEELDIHHHFVSEEVVAELQGLGIEVDVSESHPDDPEDERYNAISE